ncbi:FAD-dependent oxidoreductase [Halococcus agarilyticus]|uniref:FAD-dependent oxidoreductase n=1 Tax=Halococcus agarilyticus TaxID=1232219 RepID=UPI0006779070|nr:FAD-dependent oxidoreductase [Halococcus agarilyticus]
MTAKETVSADVTVVGGGMAGTCAALAAARLGCETVLINDRPVLGGNASSEVRVWINGATGGNNNRYARESGIIEELLQRNKHDNPAGSPDAWDAVLVDAVRAEANLECYLNTIVTDLTTDDDEVTSVTGHQLMSERTIEFRGPQFVDATGDGVLADKAGAEWIQGRESEAAYDERAAPSQPDRRTLGSSIMFSSKVADEPVAYEPPTFAHEFKENPPGIIAERTDPQQRDECYWWIEYGGDEDLDPITDNDEIRDELWATVYGIWDYIKNSGEFPEEEVANLQLEWVGKVPGKRESRRVMGDHVLTEHDVVTQRRFEDRVGHGGWSIDLHPPSGIYDDQGRGSQHYHIDGPYTFPYRSLYARDLDNVFLAGRHVSASHVAFGTLRVQMTLATVGQAVGTAAALCRHRSETPAELASSESGTDELQQTLLRNDQWVVDVPNRDPTDLARDATVVASSAQPSSLTDPETTVTLDGDTDIGFHLAHAGELESIELLLDADPGVVDGDTLDVVVEVYDENRPENTVPNHHIGETTVAVSVDDPSWVEIPVNHDVGEEQGVFLVLRNPDGVRVHSRERELTGVMAFPEVEHHSHSIDGLPEQSAFWGQPDQHEMAPFDWVPCFRTTPASATPLFAAENVVDGYSRPCGLGHSWISAPFEPAGGNADGAVATEAEWVEFAWDETRTVSTVQFACNTRLNEWFNIYGEEARAEPETVRDYRVEVERDDEWETVVRETDNYQRFRRHSFEPVETDRFRVVVEATNGVPWVELFEVRAYGPDHDLPLPER